MALLENIAPPCSINIGSVRGGLMNRTTATCIAGMRSKSHEQDQNPFSSRDRVGRTLLRGVSLLSALASSPRDRWGEPSATRCPDRGFSQTHRMRDVARP